MKYIFICLMFVLGACGRESGGKSLPLLNLRLQFPAVLSRYSASYNAFVKRVEYMKIVGECGSWKKEYHFSPSEWETLLLSGAPVPDDKGQSLELSVEIWDRKKDGYRRSYPILVGKGSLTKKDFETRDPNLQIILHAKGEL